LGKDSFPEERRDTTAGISSTGPAARILGNWQVNGILTFASGQPLAIVAPFDTSQTNSLGPLANCIGPTNGGPKTVNEWFNTAAYAVPALYTFGNCSPTPGPRTAGIANIDASLFKDIRVTERFRAQFRVESFNFFNHRQLLAPSTTAGSSTFGQISSLNVNTPPRHLQFGVKFIF
jgi:hypothetical protein